MNIKKEAYPTMVTLSYHKMRIDQMHRAAVRLLERIN